MFNNFNGILRDKNLKILGAENSWTPQVEDSSGNLGSTGDGSYSYFGDICFIIAQIPNIDTTGLTATDDIIISGLPEIVKTGAGKYSSPLVTAYDSINISGQRTLVARVDNGQDQIFLWIQRDNASDVRLQVQDISSGTSDLWISGFFYF